MVNHSTLMYIVQCTRTVHTSIGEGPRYYSVLGLFPSLYPPLGPPAAVRGCSGGGDSHLQTTCGLSSPPPLSTVLSCTRLLSLYTVYPLSNLYSLFVKSSLSCSSFSYFFQLLSFVAQLSLSTLFLSFRKFYLSM